MGSMDSPPPPQVEVLQMQRKKMPSKHIVHLNVQMVNSQTIWEVK